MYKLWIYKYVNIFSLSCNFYKNEKLTLALYFVACNCNSTGTVLNTQCINDEFGQCDCKSGVMGRACDACMKQYAEFGINGCKRKFSCYRQYTLNGERNTIIPSMLLIKTTGVN